MTAMHYMTLRHISLISLCHPGVIGKAGGIEPERNIGHQPLAGWQIEIDMTRQMLPFLLCVYLFFDPFRSLKPTRSRSLADRLVVAATKRWMCKYRFDRLILFTSTLNYAYLPPKDFFPFHFPFDLCGCKKCVGLSRSDFVKCGTSCGSIC